VNKNAKSSKETSTAIKCITDSTSKISSANELINKSNALEAVEGITRYFSNIGRDLAEKNTGYGKYFSRN
jgi:hypothetical protein